MVARGALHQRMAVLGVADGRLQHVAQAHGAVVAQHQHVGLEGAGNAGRQQPRARHDVEAEVVAIVRDGGAGRRRALAADDLRLAVLLASHSITGTSPPGPHRCGSTTCSVKAVAMPASKALPPRSRMPMPTAVPIQCVEATTPNVPSISGRVVNWPGLMLDMGGAGSRRAILRCDRRLH